MASHEIQELEVDGPYVTHPTALGVRFRAEVIQKATGERMTLREIAVYSVAEGKIVLEEFFMLPK